ncbi:hypothetical protein [Tersicoccus solisilvae]|uniref:hypothetical protein n=1 Tax=Tersicoccus solisilvae TaxID=1882339 RepID=UPI00166C84B3|nr:hypothetical protein [Tersicoccus solisilvae]
MKHTLAARAATSALRTAVAALVAGCLLTVGLAADVVTAPHASATGPADPCVALNANAVRFNVHGAPRVTFAVAAGRNSSYVTITHCARTASGYVRQWGTDGWAGANGFSAPNAAWENTFRSPTGSFTMTEALGRANPGTRLAYHTVKPASRWGGERGATYNQYFEGAGGESDENLHTLMNEGYYEQAAVINWNRRPDMDTRQGASFAIFFHAGWTKSAGCISTHLWAVTRLLQGATPGDRIVMGAASDLFTTATAGDGAARYLVPTTTDAIRSAGDVLAVDAGGVLWNYPAHGNTTLAVRRSLGAGWGTARSLHVVDWDGDGRFDVVALFRSGVLTVYPGTAGGSLGPARVLARNWAGRTVVAGWWGSGRAVLARDDASGVLTEYRRAAGDGLAAGRRIGGGWQGLRLTLVDWDGDGYGDVLATRPNGELALYRGAATGTFRAEARPVLGAGWRSVTAVTPLYAFGGTGSRGITGRWADGTLHYYPSTGGRVVIGGGWSPYHLAG